MSLFVDTSIWYAAADAGDRSNEVAREVLSAGDDLVTTDHILIECWFLLRRRLHRDAAETFWEGLRGGVALIEPASAADLEHAWTIGRDYRDQDFSIVDRTSFAIMQRLGIEQAATLDSDFAIYRFGPRRQRGFVVLP